MAGSSFHVTSTAGYTVKSNLGLMALGSTAEWIGDYLGTRLRIIVWHESHRQAYYLGWGLITSTKEQERRDQSSMRSS